MPQAIPIIVGVVAKAAGWSALWSSIAVAAASIVAGAIQNRQAQNAADRERDAAKQGYKTTTRSTQSTHRVLYGEHLVAGNEVFLEASGDTNQYLWSVLNFGEGEVEGIAQVDGIDQIFIDNKLYNEFGGNVSYWFYNGTADQTYNTQLYDAHFAAFGNQADPDFVNYDDNKRNAAYGVFRFTHDQEHFSGKPDVIIKLKGKKLYDFRDETIAYSTNPVLCAYDWFTNQRYGLGMSSDFVDLPSWVSAANYCDTKGWTLNMIIDSQGSSFDAFEEILRHFRGVLIWSEGKFALRYADLNYESTVKTITDEHIVRDSSGRASITIEQPSIYSRPDGIRVKYINADMNYSFDDINIGDTIGNVVDFRLLGTTNRDQAAEIGVYQLERQQLDRVISGVFRDDCAELEPHDLVTFSTTARSIDSQLMRVIGVDIQPNGLVGLSMIYESLSLYNLDFDTTSDDVYTCTLPDPTTPPPPPGNVVVAEETYTFRLRTATRLIVDFDAPAGYPSGLVRYYEVWVSWDSGVTYAHQFNVTNSFNIDPVEEGTEIYIKLLTVSVLGVKTEIGQEYVVNHTVAGLTGVPDSVGSLQAVVNQNTINLYAAPVDNSDIDIYEFRLGSSWNGAIFLAAMNRPNLSLNGVKPGEHTFWANTLRNNGIYGNTPRSMSVSMIDPPDGWTVVATEIDDYTDSEATFQNTEQVVYSLENYLKCSHGSAGLTGTYTSRIFDRTISDRFLVYIVAAMTATGAGTTWEDQFPGTWEAGIEGRTWREIFTLENASSISAKLKYGDTSPPENEVDRLEILSAIVIGRYFQIEITITDPSDAITGLVENYALKFAQF